MTIELMDYDEDDFYDDVTVGVGAATALQHMADPTSNCSSERREPLSGFSRSANMNQTIAIVDDQSVRHPQNET